MVVVTTQKAPAAKTGIIMRELVTQAVTLM
jgi:hypothetical protein